MNNKEKIYKTLSERNNKIIPVTPHWWGLYKFEYAGLLNDYSKQKEAWSLSGNELAEIDEKFYNEFKPDMFHLTTGASLIKESESIKKEKKRIFEAVYNLESYSIIDEYVDSHYLSKDEIIKSGVFDHIKILSEKYNEQSLLMLNEGNPISWILDPNGCLGFENGLISLIEKSDKVEYLIHKSYEALIERMKALKEMGADGYIGSETYCSTDLISPDLYRNIIFDAQSKFYTKLNDMNLIPITYFTGDINPLIADIKKLGVWGLMIEESKKNFTLDIKEIYNKLEREICLFGNLDSIYTMQMGSKEEVIEETLKQIDSCNKGGFIMSNGCPLSFSTPNENIHAMIDTVNKRNRNLI